MLQYIEGELEKEDQEDGKEVRKETIIHFELQNGPLGFKSSSYNFVGKLLRDFSYNYL